MTNADKFLKDGVSVEEFVNEFHNFCAKQNNNNASSIRLEQFLSRKAQPTLTEDEKVILRNIKDKQKVIFNDGSNLWTRDIELEDNFFGQFNHLFQFIKERRRI